MGTNKVGMESTQLVEGTDPQEVGSSTPSVVPQGVRSEQPLDYPTAQNVVESPPVYSVHLIESVA